MSSSAAVRRLRKEYQLLQSTPEYGFVAAPLESNIFEWHFVLYGTSETPYQGGLYHGKLVFPCNFPMKPPSILMITESGRFSVNKKICMSMSDFHPELWNPMWGVRSILIGLLSFMNGEELTTGGVNASSSQRVDLAMRSLNDIKRDDVVAELFPGIISVANYNLDYIDSWPPPASDPPCTTAPDAYAVTDSGHIKPSALETTSIEDVEDPLLTATCKVRTAKNNARKRAKAKAAKHRTPVIDEIDHGV